MADIEGELTQTEESDSIAIAGGVLIQASLAVTLDDATVSSGGTTSVEATVDITEEEDSVSSAGGVLVDGILNITEEDDESKIQDVVLTAYETVNFLGTLSYPYRFLLPEYTGKPDPTGVRNIGDATVSLTMVAQSGEKLWQPAKGSVAATDYDYINYTLRPGEELLFVPLSTRGWLKYPGDPFGINSPAAISFVPQSTTGDGTTTIDWRHGNNFNFQFGAFSETFTFTAPDDSCDVVLKLVQDSVGSRTVTWPGTVKWTSGTPPTLTTTPTTGTDLIEFYFDGTNYNQKTVILDLQ
jgi:hypothetical protein